jgi:hypothetical protein
LNYLNQIAKNVTKGWKSSLIGVAIIIAALVSVFAKDVSWVDATVAISVGIGLLFAPDDAIKKANK